MLDTCTSTRTRKQGLNIWQNIRACLCPHTNDPPSFSGTVKPPIFSDISHLQNFQPSSNSSVCRATTFDVPYGKSLQKSYTSYSFQFQDIPWTLIPEKVVFYHSSQWKIVFTRVAKSAFAALSYLNSYSLLSCLYIISKFYQKFPFLLTITRYHSKASHVWSSCAKTPVLYPSPLYFQPCATPCQLVYRTCSYTCTNKPRI